MLPSRILHDLTVRGDNGRPVLSQGDPEVGFFRIDGKKDVSVLLESLAFDGDGATPAVRLTRGSLTLRDVVTYDTVSTSAVGGAVYAESDATALVIEDSALSESRTDQASGGIVAALGGTLTIRNTTLSGGTASDHGGLVHSEGDLTIEDSALSGGEAFKRGGGVYARGGGATVTIRRTTFDGSIVSSDRGGGGLYNEGTDGGHRGCVVP